MSGFHIFTDLGNKENLSAIIDSVPHLNEIVGVSDLAEIQDPGPHYLVIRPEGMYLSIDWDNTFPPYILPHPVAFTPANLLALVFTRLNNYEQALSEAGYATPLYREIDRINCLQYGVPQPAPETSFEHSTRFETYRYWHNTATLAHYGVLPESSGNPYEKASVFYREALDAAVDEEWQAFTAVHYATLLLDLDKTADVSALLGTFLARNLSDEASYSLMAVKCQLAAREPALASDSALLEETRYTFREVISYFERRQQPARVALLLNDASAVSLSAGSFSESLEYVNRAIRLLEEEDLPEILAAAWYQKATVLFTWSQNGNPGMVRPALKACLEALKFYTQEETPTLFAELQHYLGVLYSEIPDDVAKKSIWASVSVRSFQHALGFFTKEEYPYEYARICNNYGNALTKFPKARFSDNYARALEQYREALKVRTAPGYPQERALTILNFLEAAWLVQLDDESVQQYLFEEMQRFASEIPLLVQDPVLTEQAAWHIQKLGTLA